MKPTNGQDFFSRIAQTEVRDSGLQKPNDPIPFKKRVCVLKETQNAPCITPEPMRTKEELDVALGQLRQRYQPYLAHYAPLLPALKRKIPVREFVLDGQKKVTIPHYNGLVGSAVQTYTAEFSLESFSGKAIYICPRLPTERSCN